MSLADCLKKKRMESVDGVAAGAAAPSPDAAPHHAHGTEKTEHAGLMIVCRNRRTWGFPWSHYIESLLVHADANEVKDAPAECGALDTLTVIFGSREVTLRGRNLAPLHEAIVRRRVWEIRETPEKFATTAGGEGGGPLVAEITVRERGR